MRWEFILPYSLVHFLCSMAYGGRLAPILDRMEWLQRWDYSLDGFWWTPVFLVGIVWSHNLPSTCSSRLDSDLALVYHIQRIGTLYRPLVLCSALILCHGLLFLEDGIQHSSFISKNIGPSRIIVVVVVVFLIIFKGTEHFGWKQSLKPFYSPWNFKIA